jgi:hypothetical protein
MTCSTGFSYSFSLALMAQSPYIEQSGAALFLRIAEREAQFAQGSGVVLVAREICH